MTPDIYHGITIPERERREKDAQDKIAKRLSWKSHIQNLHEIVGRESHISRASLLDKSGLSMWVFNKVKGLFVESYPDIEYDDKKKIYHLVDVSLSPSPQNFLCIYTPQVKNENVQEVQF